MASLYLPSGVSGATTRTSADTGLLPSIPGVGGAPTFGMTAGTATVSGIRYENSAPLTKAGTNNGTGNPRIDRLVLRLDTSAKVVTAEILPGTPGSSPSPPSYAPSGSFIYLPIARATVVAGGSVYSSLIDERMFSGRRDYVGPAAAATPGSLQAGDTWYITDTDRMQVYNGSAFRDIAEHRFVKRNGTNTGIGAGWTGIPFATLAQGTMVGVSTSDDIIYTLQPGLWDVRATLVPVANIGLIAALFEGSVSVDPLNVGNIEVYSLVSGTNTGSVGGVTVAAEIYVPVGSTRQVRCSAFASGTTLRNTGTALPRLTFSWRQ